MPTYGRKDEELAMVSRFRNQLTLIPPVQIKVTRGGIATAVCWGGSKGSSPYAAPLRSLGDPRYAGPLPTDRALIPGTRHDFGGGAVGAMTSAGLDDLKNLLLATAERQREIRADVRTAKRQLLISRVGRALAWMTGAAAVSGSLRAKVGTAVAVRQNEVQTLRDNLDASRISISFDMETAVADPHRRMLAAFDRLSAGQRSWVLQTTQRIDRVRARSLADTVVSRKPAALGRRADPIVDTADPPLAIAVQNGRSTAYVYPGFVLVMDQTRTDFAVVDLKDLTVAHSDAHFTETDAPPTDATIIGRTWAKSNKDGSRDRRFRDNKELPIMLYGGMTFSSPAGLDESFMFSRRDECREFVTALAALKQMLGSSPSGRHLGRTPKAIPDGTRT